MAYLLDRAICTYALGFNGDAALIERQIGMSLMASTPADGSVYPLIGRPHDFLKEGDQE